VSSRNKTEDFDQQNNDVVLKLLTFCLTLTLNSIILG